MPRDVLTTRRSSGAQASCAGSWGGGGKGVGWVEGALAIDDAVLWAAAWCQRAFLLAFGAGWRRLCLLEDFSAVSGCCCDVGVVKACWVAKAKGSLLVADRHGSVTLFPGTTTYSRPATDSPGKISTHLASGAAAKPQSSAVVPGCDGDAHAERMGHDG